MVSSFGALMQRVTPSWSSSLLLPKSKFGARPNLADRARYLRQCTDDLYAWQQDSTSTSTSRPFLLLDGPPYANGKLHVGHALNKILKDITCRVQLFRGRKIKYLPGWDCHGLPIEIKALQGHSDSEPSTIRRLARELATKSMREQKTEFRSWAIMADWEHSWSTMDRAFELRQLQIFKSMLAKGLIHQRYKPVYWSPSSRTALAEAELEYQTHASSTAYVKFPLLHSGGREKSLVIWTTTPWTLPANKAIAVHANMTYLEVESSRGLLIIAESRFEEMQKSLGALEVQAKVKGSDLVGMTYAQFFESTGSVLHADFVSADAGTGLVHVAPGHGMDDYKLCQQHGIGISAPVDDAGCFVSNAMTDTHQIAGLEVLGAGTAAVLDIVKKKDLLLATESLEHQYPYDWRSKQPVIIRATKQWFADAGAISPAAIEALSTVDFVPESGRERLSSFVRGRSEWCISRQRAWGVPIPVLYDEAGIALLTPESVDHVLAILEERGTDAWWTDHEDDPRWTPPWCGSLHRRGKDTMDVWFDSGTSWSMDSMADVMLEGTDQHRGWFQSSLLTKVAGQAQAPCRTLITHGFTLDAAGRKMSKSEGNVISPNDILQGRLLPQRGSAHDAMGPDALRLWVASSDYTKDIVVGVPILKAVHASLAKLRVTFKLLLGLLDDFAGGSVDFNRLRWIDQLALLNLGDLMTVVSTHYRQFSYHQALAAINQYVNSDLSAFYIESIKDRMYTEARGSETRRHAQMVLWQVFQLLARMLAPMTPLLIEEACEHLPSSLSFHPVKSPHSTDVRGEWKNDLLRQDAPHLFALGSAVKSLQEAIRGKKLMGSSLQCQVQVQISESSNVHRVLLRNLAGLADFWVVSQVEIVQESIKNHWANSTVRIQGEDLVVHISAPQGEKCPRCWKYTAPQTALCGRCISVLRDSGRDDLIGFN